MRRSSKIHGSGIFFPAAALYAALAVPLSVYAMTTASAWPPGLIGPGHAHEMLFGFALALVAGYLLGPVSRQRLLLLFVIWLAARISYALAPASPVAVIASPLFALVLAACIVPKFRSAKKWRNRSVGPLLLALCVLPTVFAAKAYFPGTGQYELLPAGIVLLALLMAFMGGRIIAPAAAGAFYRRDMNLANRVQPRLEASLIILLAVAATALLLPHGRYVAALGAGAAGVIAAVRLVRWHLWEIRDRSDLMGLAAGYGWLSLGLILMGGLLAAGRSVIPALHVITVGALGTLSICVMTRVHLQHSRRDPARAAPVVTYAIVLIAVATVARWTANLVPGLHAVLLSVAAAGWTLAYLLTAALLLKRERKTA